MTVELSIATRAGLCTGPGPCDTSPLGEGKNWVTERGGLPAYIRAIAHALQRERGLDESAAIQTAIAAVKHWAGGGGGVSAATRAKAAEAVAHWEAMKGTSGKRAFNPSEARVTSGAGGGRWTASGTAGQSKANPGWVRSIDGRTAANKHKVGRSPQSLMTELAGEVGGLSTQTGHNESQSDVAARWKEAHSMLGENTVGANFYAEAQNVGKISQGLKTPSTAQITQLAHQLASSADWSKLTPLQRNLYMEIANVRLLKQMNPRPRKARQTHPRQGHKVHATASPPAAGHRAVDQDNAAYRQGIADRQAGKAQLTAAAFREAHPDADADDYPLYQAGYDADRDDLEVELKPRTRAADAIARLEELLGRRAVAEWGPGGPPTPDASGSASLLPVAQSRPPKPRQANLVTDQMEHHRFQGKDLQSCSRCGRPVSAEVHRRPKVVEAGERHAGPGHDPVASGHIRGDIRRRATTAKAAHDRSAQSLEEPLTDALRRYFADQRTSTLARLNGKRGKQMLKRAGVRAANPPAGGPPASATPLPAGAARAIIVPSAVAATLGGGVTGQALLAGVVTPAALASALGVAETALAPSLGFRSHGELVAALLAGQVTLAMLKAAFPAQTAAVHLPGPAAAPVSAVTDFGTPTAPLDASPVFDQSYWNDRLEQILKPYYDAAATHAVVNVRRHLELPPDFEDGSSLSAARAMLAARGNQTSPMINSATYREIVAQLQAGASAGEGIDGLAARVGATFETADRVRARRIAQTEVQSALNGSANLYAQSLPAGTVGAKRWLAHWPPTGGPDERTRDDHRLAAGQTVPVGSPFYVGGWPMMYPGDPAAPADQVVNCRCALMFLPPGGDGGSVMWAAKAVHAATAAQAGVSLSPAAAAFIGS